MHYAAVLDDVFLAFGNLPNARSFFPAAFGKMPNARPFFLVPFGKMPKARLLYCGYTGTAAASGCRAVVS